MQTTTTTTAAPTSTASAAKPKQFTFGITENHKNELGELRKEFTRPAAVAKAPAVPMSEKELIEVLYTVATDRRFKTVGKVDESGNPVFDTDGIQEFETIDLFEVEWDKIKARDYSPAPAANAKKDEKIQSLIQAIRTLGRQMAKSEGEIQVMIENALRPPVEAAPVEA